MRLFVVDKQLNLRYSEYIYSEYLKFNRLSTTNARTARARGERIDLILYFRDHRSSVTEHFNYSKFEFKTQENMINNFVYKAASTTHYTLIQPWVKVPV